MPDSTRVLVTGGCGFIGQHLVRALLARGHRVHVLDDMSTGSPERFPARPELTVQQACVTDEAAVADACRDAAAVYHLASVVGMRLATAQAARAYEVSDVGTRHVLRHAGAAAVVLVSSSAVYGRHHADPARETAPLDDAEALDYDGGHRGYASGKLALERHGLAAMARGAPVVIVRPFNVVGPHQSGSYGMVLPTFVERALAGQPLTVYDDGAQTRAFSDVGVFVEALVDLARDPRALGGTFNVGTSTTTPVLELARLVLALSGCDVPIERVPYERAFPGRRDVRTRVPDTSRLRALLGELPWPPLEQTVSAVLASCRAEVARP